MPESARAADDVTPLDVDGVLAMIVGTVVWAVALVVALLLRDRLTAAGNGWWIWVAFAGVLLGIPGIAYTVRRRDVYRRAREAAADLDEGKA